MDWNEGVGFAVVGCSFVLDVRFSFDLEETTGTSDKPGSALHR
jgi:hypothetical protein